MNIDRDKLIEMAKAHGASITTSYYLSLEGVEVPYKQITLTESQLASIVSAHAIASMQTEQEPIAEVVEFKMEAWSKPNATVKWHKEEFDIGTKFYTHPAPVTSMQGDSNPYTSIQVLAEIREILGVGHKPMMFQLPDILRERVKGVRAPIEPTKAMLEAAEFSIIRTSVLTNQPKFNTVKALYAAMIAASQDSER